MSRRELEAPVRLDDLDPLQRKIEKCTLEEQAVLVQAEDVHRGKTLNDKETEELREPRTSLLSLPAEIIDEIVYHLTPVADLQCKVTKSYWDAEKLLDSWNQDVDSLSRTCWKLREGLVTRHRKRVVVIKDDFEDLQEKLGKFPKEDRSRVTGLVFYRNRNTIDLGGKTDYLPLLNAFPNLRAVKHYGQTRPLRLATGFSTWNYPRHLDVVDIFHTSSMFEEKLLPPGVEPTSVSTLILRDGYNEPSEMLYDDPRNGSRLGHVSYLAQHFKNVRKLVLFLEANKPVKPEEVEYVGDQDFDDENFVNYEDQHRDSEDEDMEDIEDPERSEDTVQGEKETLRVLLTDDFPDLQSVEFRFGAPSRYENRDVCLLDGFRDLFKRFKPNIKHIRFFLRLEGLRWTSENGPNAHVETKQTRLYWAQVKSHSLPTVERLERSVREIAESIPSLETYEFRIDDGEIYPDVPENARPVLSFSATIDRQPDPTGREVSFKTRYEDRVPAGTPNLPLYTKGTPYMMYLRELVALDR